MTTIMTPSKTMTLRQVDKAVARYRALLEKYSGKFEAEVVQAVLGQSSLAEEQREVFCRRVEAMRDENAKAMNEKIVRRVEVNLALTGQEALDATGYEQHTEREAMDCMPKGEKGKAEITIFRPYSSRANIFISDEDVEDQFKLRKLKPADPHTLAAFNEAEPYFALHRPNGTHWKNAAGQWCCMVFHWTPAGDRRFVRVKVSEGFGGNWNFVGVPL